MHRVVGSFRDLRPDFLRNIVVCVGVIGVRREADFEATTFGVVSTRVEGAATLRERYVRATRLAFALRGGVKASEGGNAGAVMGKVCVECSLLRSGSVLRWSFRTARGIDRCTKGVEAFAGNKWSNSESVGSSCEACVKSGATRHCSTTDALEGIESVGCGGVIRGALAEDRYVLFGAFGHSEANGGSGGEAFVRVSGKTRGNQVATFAP
jgi:hypothetical protein